MRFALPALLLALALGGCRLELRAPEAAAAPAAEAPPAPAATDPAGQPGEVVLYVTEWCPYCAQARDYMEAEGVPHRVVDIEKDAEGAREYQALGGDGGIPLVAVGPNVMRGWSAEAARQMLDAEGYE